MDAQDQDDYLTVIALAQSAIEGTTDSPTKNSVLLAAGHLHEPELHRLLGSYAGLMVRLANEGRPVTVGLLDEIRRGLLATPDQSR